MKAREVIAEFMETNDVQDPEQMLTILADWFDEHDETEGLAEYLQYWTENQLNGRNKLRGRKGHGDD